MWHYNEIMIHSKWIETYLFSISSVPSTVESEVGMVTGLILHNIFKSWFIKLFRSYVIIRTLICSNIDARKSILTFWEHSLETTCILQAILEQIYFLHK